MDSDMQSTSQLFVNLYTYLQSVPHDNELRVSEVLLALSFNIWIVYRGPVYFLQALFIPQGSITCISCFQVQ